jgi:hypothetical protein
MPPDLFHRDLARVDPFRAGACSIQFLAGGYFMTGWGPVGPDVDYAPLSLRVGYMLTDPCPNWIVPVGTCEVLFDYTAAPITRTFGSYFTGPSLILRYTHHDPTCLVQPYVQGGVGLFFTDAHRAPVYQELIGQSCEFLLRAELGLRFMVTERISLDVEGGLQHISNAGMARRNGGINNLGFAVGLTYSFGRP